MNLDSRIIWESYKSINEAPVDEIGVMGNWEDPRKQKYDSPSIKLLKNPKHIENIRVNFANNITNKFNLYFIKSKEASKHSEVGLVSVDQLRSMINDVDIQPIIDSIKSDVITVLFTNNVGVEKVPLTKWMIGHRIGHVLYRAKFQDKEINTEWTHFLRSYRDTMQGCYNIDDVNRFPMDKNTKKTLNRLGMFRSARENKINRPFEFIYEVFSQFLNNGSIEFNEYGDRICSYELQNVFEGGIGYILKRAEGKLFLM